MQLDMTAPPRYSKGSLFTWTVYDYPLKQAILGNVVKRPLKGVAKGLGDRIGDVSTREEEGGPIEVRPVVELKR
jgi:type III restriction enzyme